MPDPKLDISGYLITTTSLDEQLREQGYRLLADWQLDLVTVTGYLSRYHHHMSKCPTYLEAWEKTEEEFRTTFGRKRFDNYDSFRLSSQVKRHLKGK